GSNSIRLIQDRDKYFKHPLFRERVRLDYHMLELGVIDEEVLLKQVVEIINDKRCRTLIEFIRKKSADSFYKRLNERFPGRTIFLLTGDDNVFVRKKILGRINE